MSLAAQFRVPLATAGLAVLLAGPGCIDIVGADVAKYVEREEKTFSTSGKPDVSLATFDGSIEVRPWDKSEVHVIIEKRARDKAAVDEIDIHTEQNGNRIVVDVKPRKGSDHRGMNIGWNMSRSAKLIVSMPASISAPGAATGRSTSSGSPAAWRCDRATAASGRTMSAET